MPERERRKWLRFNVHQEGVSNCALLDRKGRALPMLISDIGMGGLCLTFPRGNNQGSEQAAPAVGMLLRVSSSCIPRFGRRIHGRRICVVWSRPVACGCRFDSPLFGQPTGLRHLLAALGLPAVQNWSTAPAPMLARLAARFGWCRARILPDPPLSTHSPGLASKKMD